MFKRVDLSHKKSAHAWLKRNKLNMRRTVVEKLDYPERVDIYADKETKRLKVVNNPEGAYSVYKTSAKRHVYTVATWKIMDALLGDRTDDAVLSFKVNEFTAEKIAILAVSSYNG